MASNTQGLFLEGLSVAALLFCWSEILLVCDSVRFAFQFGLRFSSVGGSLNLVGLMKCETV